MQMRWIMPASLPLFLSVFILLSFFSRSSKDLRFVIRGEAIAKQLQEEREAPPTPSDSSVLITAPLAAFQRKYSKNERAQQKS